jgi:starch phosphorylase
MVAEYEQRFYLPAVQRKRELLENDGAEARRLSVLHERLKKLWSQIRVEKPERDLEGPFQVEDTFSVSAKVHLGLLRPEEVDVELYYGRMKRIGELDDGTTQKMSLAADQGAGLYLYRSTVTCRDSGRYGFTVRVLPQSDEWIRTRPGLLTWA